MTLRSVFVLLVLIEIGLIVAPFVSYGVESPKAARAWSEWHLNSNAETQKAWMKEKARVSVESVTLDIVLSGLLIANSICLFRIGKKVFAR